MESPHANLEEGMYVFPLRDGELDVIIECVKACKDSLIDPVAGEEEGLLNYMERDKRIEYVAELLRKLKKADYAEYRGLICIG